MEISLLLLFKFEVGASFHPYISWNKTYVAHPPIFKYIARNQYYNSTIIVICCSFQLCIFVVGHIESCINKKDVNFLSMGECPSKGE
jgi:hypothetical protein